MIARIFHGDGQPHDWELPPAPPWRQFSGAPVVTSPHEADWAARYPNDLERARTYQHRAVRSNLLTSPSCCAGHC